MSADPLHLFHGIRAPGLTWAGKVVNGYLLNQVKDFWSVIVYDNQTRSMVQTDQKSPSLSSQNKALKTNTDGSVDVYFGPRPPSGLENNWVQTLPGKGWFMILRLY